MGCARVIFGLVGVSMNNQSSDSENSQRHDALAPVRTLSTDALARRRLLLKGATGGTAALAALTPVGALATGTSTVLTCVGNTGAVGLCSHSGVQSAAHSFGSNITQIPAAGKNATYWKDRATWPTTSPTVCAKTTAVSTVLAGCSSTFSGKNMLWALQYQPASVEAIWICAYLNGATMYNASGPTATQTFPYSSTQVKAFWDAGSTTRSNAYGLFSRITTQST